MAKCIELKFLKDLDIFDGTFESIEKNIFMRLFNQQNLPFDKDLDKVPHIKTADLAITYSVEKKTYINKQKSRECYLITNEDLEMLKVEVDRLKEIAIENAFKHNSAKIETLFEHAIRGHIMHPLTSVPNNMPLVIDVNKVHNKRKSIFDGSQFGQLPLYNNMNENKKDVLMISNRTQTYASVNMFGETLDKVYDKFQENFYILPMSVHEVICIREGYATKEGELTTKEAVEELKDMIEEVNDVLIEDATEILSYNVYYHSKDDCCTMIVTN